MVSKGDEKSMQLILDKITTREHPACTLTPAHMLH